jgi:hypothetical protein
MYKMVYASKPLKTYWKKDDLKTRHKYVWVSDIQSIRLSQDYWAKSILGHISCAWKRARNF